MTNPVSEDDILSGAASYVLSLSDVTALLGSNEYGPFVWQEFPLENMEKLASTGIVLKTSSSALSDEAHTQHFSRLEVEIWTGPIRDDLGNVIEPAETRRRMMAVYRKLDRHLHRTDPHEQYWGSIRTYSSERAGEIYYYSPRDGSEIVVGQVSYVVQYD